jgi:hypothetical protein
VWGEHVCKHVFVECVLQVTDWLEYVLGKAEQPPSFMRREGPPERKRRAKKEPGGQRSPRAARSPNISAGGVGDR